VSHEESLQNEEGAIQALHPEVERRPQSREEALQVRAKQDNGSVP
jgi:hypothetical protein